MSKHYMMSTSIVKRRRLQDRAELVRAREIERDFSASLASLVVKFDMRSGRL